MRWADDDAALVAADRRRRDIRVRRRRQRRRHARRAQHPRDPRSATGFGVARFTRRHGTTRNRLQANGSRRSAPAPAPSSTCPRSRPTAAHLTVFQRTPIWVSPRFDEPFTAEQQELFERDPAEALQGPRCGLPGLRGRQLRRRLRDDEGPDGYGPRVPDPQGGRSANCGPSSRPSYPVGCKRPLQSRDLVSDVRAAERDAGDRRRSSSSPSAVCAPPTASTTSSTPSSTEPASTPPTTWAASTCTERVADDCATTGATAPRRIWAPWCRATRTCSRCTDPTPTASPRSSTSSKRRPSSSVASSTTWPRPGCAPSTSSARCTTTYNAEIQQAMEGTVWLANCNNYYRHPNGKVVTQFPYSGTTFVDMLAAGETRRLRLSPAD